MAIHYRKLTKNSKLNFGKNKDLTIGRMLELRKHESLISIYYKVSSIDFFEDILSVLGIDEKYRIEKPGISRELYYKFLNDKGYEKRSKRNADKLKLVTKVPSKDVLKSINQGKQFK